MLHLLITFISFISSVLAFATDACTSEQYITPIAGSDGVPGVIAAGPTFTTSSVNLVASDTDSLSLTFQNPLVVNVTHDAWTRAISFFFTDASTSVPDLSTFDSTFTSAKAACKFSQASDVALSGLVADGASTCSPTFTKTSTWETIRSADNGCGLVEDTSDATYFIYSGNVWVKWTDDDGAGFSRSSAFTSYPVTIKFEKALNQTNTGGSNNTVPYVADSFSVTGVTYTKSGANVALKIVYTISTYWPYLVMPNHAAGAFSGGVPANANGLTVPYHVTYGGSYSDGTISHTSGCPLIPSDSTTRPSDGICTFTQEVTYTWAYASHCDAGSASPFQFRFATCVYTGTNGGVNEGCLDQNLVDQAGDTVGDFTIGTGINLCAAPANAYDLSASVALAPIVSTVEVGQQVSFGTTITSSGKQMNRAVVWEHYATDSVKGTTYTFRSNNGDVFTTPVGYSTNADLATDALSVDMTMSYTPNVGATDSANYMIILSDRSRGSVSFTNFVRIRVYWDSVNSAEGNGFRRLMYRDQVVSQVSQAQDLTQTADVRVKVPSGASTSQAGLSTAAVAGIAVAGTVLVVSGLILGALVYRKRRQVVQMSEDSSQKSLNKV